MAATHVGKGKSWTQRKTWTYGKGRPGWGGETEPAGPEVGPGEVRAGRSAVSALSHAHAYNEFRAGLGADGLALPSTGPRPRPESVQGVRVSPSASAASLHYFFRFSFMSFLCFVSLFFNFLFCLGSCFASNFLFLSLFRLTIEAFCPALFKTSFHSSSSPRIMY